MDLRGQLEKYRQEHQGVLRFLNEWEAALTLAESEQDAERSKGLAELREMGSKLQQIRQHCREEEEDQESPFLLYLPDADLRQMKEEHVRWAQLSSDLCRELTFATILRTGEMVHLGRQLLSLLRQHVVFEEGLLERIEGECSAADARRLRRS